MLLLQGVWIFQLLWLSSLFGAGALDPNHVKFQVAATPEDVRVGDLIRVTVRAEHVPGTTLTMVDPPDHLGDFEVRSIEPQEPIGKDGAVFSSWIVTVATFQTGTLTLPGLEFKVSGEGVSGDSISSEPFEITIKSVLPEDAGDILDIKGPLDMPRAWWSYWPWALGAILVAAALWLWRRRRRKKAPRPAASAPLLPPEEEALAALRKLENAGLVEGGQLGEFYLRLSAIARRYLGRRGDVVTLEATTAEILDQLVKKDALALARRARPLLQHCDLVKFAKVEPPRDRTIAALGEARDLVETGRPAPPRSESLTTEAASL